MLASKRDPFSRSITCHNNTYRYTGSQVYVIAFFNALCMSEIEVRVGVFLEPVKLYEAERAPSAIVVQYERDECGIWHRVHALDRL